MLQLKLKTLGCNNELHSQTEKHKILVQSSRWMSLWCCMCHEKECQKCEESAEKEGTHLQERPAVYNECQ